MKYFCFSRTILPVSNQNFFIMFSLNLPTTQNSAQWSLFDISQAAKRVKYTGQNALSGTQSWDQSLVCSEHYIWQQETRQSLGHKKSFTPRCQKSPSVLNFACFPSWGSDRQAEIKPVFLNQMLSPCTIVRSSAKVLTAAKVLLLWRSWYHLPMWTTPHFYKATSHVTYTTGREVPVFIWFHQYHMMLEPIWTLLQQICL